MPNANQQEAVLLNRIERARAAMKIATSRAALIKAMNQVYEAEKAYDHFIHTH